MSLREALYARGFCQLFGMPSSLSMEWYSPGSFCIGVAVARIRWGMRCETSLIISYIFVDLVDPLMSLRTRAECASSSMSKSGMTAPDRSNMFFLPAPPRANWADMSAISGLPLPMGFLEPIGMVFPVQSTYCFAFESNSQALIPKCS